MTFLDTSVIVPAILARHPNHARCIPLLQRNAATSAHALAECFCVLTAAYHLKNSVAWELLEPLPEVIRVEPISLSDYLRCLEDTARLNITGGNIYDSIHATVARRLKAEKIFTYNLSHFQHVAPDMAVESP